MKILAVRGKNLASLAGTFEVALDRAPLDGAGLVVVTGPTGAGKSTLLDAMCLALFDETPRLRGRGAPVGFVEAADRETLTSTDPRCLVRRGAAEAKAEVDFVGRDGRRWCAAWSVRRARNRPDGRLQPQALSLTCLDTGERLGGTRTETLQAIEDALGLDYTAFCRSALLAQGEFASFLQAKATDRAALLERLTATELYGALSVAAHRRATDEARALDDLELRLAAQRALDPIARQELLGEGALRHEAVLAARRARDDAAAACRWHDERARRDERARGALAERDAADAAWTAAAARRAELARVEAAQGLRGVLETFDGAAREVEAAAAAHRRAFVEAAAAQDEDARARDVEATAATALEVAVERARAAAPSLREARDLDLSLAAAEREQAQAGRRAAEARRAADERRVEAERATAARFELEARRARATAWLEAHAQLTPLATQWPRWEAHLARHAAARTEAVDRRDRLDALAAAAGQALEARAAAAQTDEAAARELARARAVEDDLRARTPGPDARDALLRRHADLVSLEALDAQARAARAARQREDARATDARGRSDDAAARARAAAGLAAGLAPALAEAERALDTLRAARDLAGRRQDLVPHEPCPLCGAREHPWAHDVPPLDQALAEQQGRATSLRAALETARGEADAATTESRLAGAQAATALEARERLDQELVALVAAAAELTARVAVSPEQAGSAREAAAGELAALRAKDVQAEAARQARTGCERRLEEARQALAQADEAARAASRELALEGEALARAEAGASEALEALAPAFEPDVEPEGVDDAASAGDDPDDAFPLFRAAVRRATPRRREGVATSPSTSGAPAWRAEALADPTGFHAARRAEARAWLEAAAEAEAAREGHAEARVAADAAQARAEQAASAASAAAAEHAAREAAARSLREARAQVLDGRPAHEVEAALTAARADAERKLACARIAATGAGSRASAARARLEEQGERRERAMAAERAAAQALAARLAEALPGALGPELGPELGPVLGPERSLGALRELLARDEAWRQDAREELAGLERRRSAAARAADVLEAERQVHEAARPAGSEALTSNVEARAALESAARSVELAEARLLDTEARREADDRARREADRLRPLVEAQRARASTWQALSQVVGSHDGKKLRVFAQSLTLEALLERANAHLSDLAPRYRLERVEGQDLELQVRDRDLGGEVRATTGLSGGESFLVSLALALALSGLCAAGTRVESLFIDEGFGSLDPDAQEQALAALDALQASGRQVVLVSHLPAIAERVGLSVRVVPQGQGRSLVEVGAVTPEPEPDTNLPVGSAQ